MKRTLMLILLGFVFAPAAHAASVSLEGEWIPGSDTITLTVRVTANAGETDSSAFGAILYDNTRVTPVAGSNVQNALPPTLAGPWNQGSLPACTSASCRAFSQTNAGGAVNVTNFVIATMQFELNGFNVFPVTFSWQSSPVGQRLDFFGVTSAPGVCVGGFACVPEPTTAALLGAGLVGLSLARRRRA